METILGRFRNLIVLAVILFAQIVGLAVQVKRPAQQGDTRLIRVWAVAAITPFEKAVVNTEDFFSNTWHNYIYLRGVRRENRALRAELDRMKLEQVRLKEDADMARRIQSLLAFKEQHIDSTVAAQVIGTSGSDQSRVLYIDKGSNDGLKLDMAVITPKGIVGKIVQVFPESAQVLPINDQLSGVGVALRTTRLQGILRGGANGTTTVQYIMADERVVPGEEVITSGGDRIFPKGLPVGKVVDVQPGKDLFLNIRVLPSAQLDRLEEVLVVTKVTEKPPDVQDLNPIRASDILAQRLPTIPDKPAADANGNATAVPGAAGSQAATANSGKSVAGPSNAPASTTGTRATSPPPGTRPAGASSTAPRTTPATAASNATASTGVTARPSATTAKPSAGTTTRSTTTIKKPAPDSGPGTSAQPPETEGAAATPSATGNSEQVGNPGKTRKPAEQAAPPMNPATSPQQPDNPRR